MLFSIQFGGLLLHINDERKEDITTIQVLFKKQSIE